MRVRWPSPCFLNQSNTSLSMRRWTEVLPAGITIRARFQKLPPSRTASGASFRVLLAPRESLRLIPLSEYFTVVLFRVMSVCSPRADDANSALGAQCIDDVQHRIAR